MARREQDREDLLAEATALVPRIELLVDGREQPVVLGFRRTHAASVYFGADPVYQFNSCHELRRAYRDGFLYKATRGTLARLERVRCAGRVELRRVDLDGTATARFIESAQLELQRLRERLQRGDYRVVGSVPATDEPLSVALEWLINLPSPLRVASSPHAR